MSFNQILFYGGIVSTIAVIIAGIIFFLLYYIGKIKLESQFTEEYGEATDKISKGNK